VTSSLDHPVGVAHASIVAGIIKKNTINRILDCGCYTTKLYKPNEFSIKIKDQGPYILNSPGMGIGFDDLLGGISWQVVR
jgi:hypothetical protein